MKNKTIEERIEIANNIIAKANEIEPRTKGAFKVWNGGEKVRIYSAGNGFREILEDGSINAVKTMGWGHILSECY